MELRLGTGGKRNKADTGYKMRLARVFEKALRTYGRTDGQTLLQRCVGASKKR